MIVANFTAKTKKKAVFFHLIPHKTLGTPFSPAPI